MTRTDTLQTLATLATLARITDAHACDLDVICRPLLAPTAPLADDEREDLEDAMASFYNWPTSQVRRAEFIRTCEVLYTALHERI